MFKHIIILTILLLGCNKIKYNDNKEIIVMYYYNLGNSINYYNFKNKPQYNRNIASTKALKLIKSLTKIPNIEPDMAVYKVYFHNRNKYLEHVPFKSEKYNGREAPSSVYFYNEEGQLKERHLITTKGKRYITKYLYSNQMRIAKTKLSSNVTEKIISKYRNNILYEIMTFHNDNLLSKHKYMIREGRLEEVER